MPAYCTAAGRALLADHDAARLTALLAGVELERRAAEHARRASTRSRARIEAAAERGYHVADEELEPGLSRGRGPVRRFDGRIVAALNVSGPAFRFAAAARCRRRTRSPPQPIGLSAECCSASSRLR